jgi:hypothetical protein
MKLDLFHSYGATSTPPAITPRRSALRRAALDDMAMVPGQDQDPARISCLAQQRPQKAQGVWGPAHVELVGAGQLGIDGIVDHADDAL